MRRAATEVIVAGLCVASFGMAGVLGIVNAAPSAAALNATSDFNCDGYSDLAVGVPGETVGATQTGIVQVFFGSSAGLDPNAIVLRIGSIGASGNPQNGDRFGAAVKSGQLNNDTCDDLVVGAPGYDSGGAADSGAVYVFFGAASGFDPAQTLKLQRGANGIPDTNQPGAQWGSVLATGDANGNFVDELAIAAPHDGGPTTVDSGSVTVINDIGESGGSYNASSFRPGVSGFPGPAESKAHFGSALAFGNFTKSGLADFSQELAIGAPDQNADRFRDSGAIYIVAAYPSGLTVAGTTMISQNSPGIPGTSEKGDGFGFALAAGRLLGNDAADDLAVGVPNEDVRKIRDAGTVVVLAGSASGIGGSAAPGSTLFYQGRKGVPDKAERGDKFGRSLLAVNLGSDANNVDLVIGVANEDLTRRRDVGGVTIMRSVGGTLSRHNAQYLLQGSHGTPGRSERGDFFGLRLAAGDYRGVGTNDLVIGAPMEDIGHRRNAGAITIMQSDGYGVGGGGSRTDVWYQGAGGVADSAERSDQFGMV